MQAQSAAPQDTQGNDEIDLIGLLGTLVDHRRLIAGVTGVCLAGSVAYSLVATPVYKANALIQAEATRHGVDYIDIFTPMLDATGQPDEALFLEDRLHMNRAGYVIWQRVIAPYVK